MRSAESYKCEELTNRGHEYYQRRQFREALEYFNQAVEIDPNDAAAAAYRGDTYRLLGSPAEGLPDLSRAVELIPHHADVYAMRAAIYRDLGRFAEARADYNQAIALDPNCEEALKGLQETPLMTYEEAVERAKQLGALEPQTIQERIAAGLGGLARPWSQSERAQERLHFWALAIAKGEDPRITVR